MDYFQLLGSELFYPFAHFRLCKLIFNSILRSRERWGLCSIYRPDRFDIYDLIQMNRGFTPYPTSEYDLKTRQRRAQCRLFRLSLIAPIENTRLLDVGAGQGDIVWKASQLASLSVGVDIDGKVLVAATGEVTECPEAKQVMFIQSPAGKLPFENNSFDIVTSFWAFEHFVNYENVFLEMRRVLRKGGILYLDFGPLFYSPYGSHLYEFIYIPWAHLLFEETVLFDYLYQIGQAAWIDFFLSLNRMTVCDFEQLISNSAMRVLQLLYRRETTGRFYEMFKVRLSHYSLKDLTYSYITCALQKD